MKKGSWKLTEYPNVIDGFRNACGNDKKMLAALEVCLLKIQEKGHLCGMPTSEFLGNGIYQIRPKTHERQGRILYSVNEEEHKITFLCWFFKTTQATPRHVLDMAKARLKELKKSQPEIKGGENGQGG
jgi:phage-related protein